MNIVFALIYVAAYWASGANQITTTSTRIGTYTNVQLCKAEGENLVQAMKGREAKGSFFFCVPVNK